MYMFNKYDVVKTKDEVFLVVFGEVEELDSLEYRLRYRIVGKLFNNSMYYQTFSFDSANDIADMLNQALNMKDKFLSHQQEIDIINNYFYLIEGKPTQTLYDIITQEGDTK